MGICTYGQGTVILGATLQLGQSGRFKGVAKYNEEDVEVAKSKNLKGRFQEALFQLIRSWYDPEDTSSVAK